MAEYLIYFNQQWAGEHTEEWFAARRPRPAGPGRRGRDANDEAATRWAGKVAQACGWPQEVRRFKPMGPGGVRPPAG